jgi:antitoxin component YwqK of YwqJK toxin-antitoxin module
VVGGQPTGADNDPTLTTDVIPTIDLNTKRKDRFGGAFGGIVGAAKKGKAALDSARNLGQGLQADAKKLKAKRAAATSKEPKNVFYGIKATRMFLRHESQLGNGRVIIEKFYVIRDFQNPPPNTDQLYYYNKISGKITMMNPFEKPMSTFDKENYWLLHGPYEKTVTQTINRERQTYIMEAGNLYLGARNGRWEKFDKNFVLTEKLYFDRGLARDTQTTYYEGQKGQKVHEIIPLQYGMRHGTYLAYYPSGRVKERGQYQFGQKIGRWREYYDQDRFPRYRVTIHPRSYYDDKTQTYLAQEWNPSGKLVVDVKK